MALGEAGLDYHYGKAKRAQASGLRIHIEAARESGLPLVIHSRDADDDMAQTLTRETEEGAFPAILHCFSSGKALAMTGVELGLYVSFSGILTFKNSQELRDIAADIPMDRLLVETDAPYLAPTPYRGKRNEPSYVVNTAKVLAEVKGVSEEEIWKVTTENFFRLFKKNSDTGRICMSDILRFTILGCGSSPGVPRIGGDWGNCDPDNPKNRRLRSSFVVQRISETGTTTVVIDTGPDFRQQMLNAEIKRLDGVLYTPTHMLTIFMALMICAVSRSFSANALRFMPINIPLNDCIRVLNIVSNRTIPKCIRQYWQLMSLSRLRL